MDSAQVIENLAKGVEHIKELEDSHTEDFSQEKEVLKAKIMELYDKVAKEVIARAPPGTDCLAVAPRPKQAASEHACVGPKAPPPPRGSPPTNVLRPPSPPPRRTPSPPGGRTPAPPGGPPTRKCMNNCGREVWWGYKCCCDRCTDTGGKEHVPKCQTWCH